ncbi:uncharacterized protein AB675_61 [Cyphellophora attinorum]|uniref:Uncharacterized protein n=1 Tax=Cyphellophora attinorum TaxID=1664694 RepID=A0A0N1H1I7_9EURO|nr:uncharacterized protein AB675_61 [Phialophora attinorum]KPI34666.1 hypothetical protein AB675_61 [Phialophora attinorum]
MAKHYGCARLKAQGVVRHPDDAVPVLHSKRSLTTNPRIPWFQMINGFLIPTVGFYCGPDGNMRTHYLGNPPFVEGPIPPLPRSARFQLADAASTACPVPPTATSPVLDKPGHSSTSTSSPTTTSAGTNAPPNATEPAPITTEIRSATSQGAPPQPTSAYSSKDVSTSARMTWSMSLMQI